MHRDPLNWVAIFGLREGQELDIHKLIKNCGTIVKYMYFEKCNFVLAKFSKSSEATEVIAMKLNGYLLDDHSIIGVMSFPCNRLPNKILKGATPLLLNTSPINSNAVSKAKNKLFLKNKPINKSYFNKLFDMFRKRSCD
ncbi:hypothetical protein MXB_1426 [Myxobolus squamalis]|nr:hypothetical protein MXB_1426 [Myxobolus squamalis]